MKKARQHPILIAFAATIALTGAPPTVEAQPAEAPEPSRAESHRPHDSGAEAGFLGVSVRPLNADLRRHFGAPSESGVLIASVASGSPAAAAGLEVGDVIVRVGEKPVESVASLVHEVRRHAGDRVEIEVYRGGERRSLTAAIGSRSVAHRHPHGDEWAEHWEEWGEGWARWGEEFGEGWAEWGEEFGERWAELGAEMGERWGERGVEWGAIGAEIGARLGEAFAEMDWDEMDRALEESMRALDDIDWDEIGDEIERAMEEVDAALDEALDGIEIESERGRRPPA